MCCFSGKVERVAGTRIFARPVDGDRQLLAYAMSFTARGDLAMILPLPTPVGAAEDAVRFIDLSGYPDLFDRLQLAFPQPQVSRGGPALRPASLTRQLLVVHEVGAFEASFVPSVADFARLDERFRLPDRVWGDLPAYRDHGFAVFKLRATAADGAGPTDVHPMVFEFPRRDPRVVFFPTVHVHDGRVHRRALFDHTLYWQGAPGGEVRGRRVESAPAVSVAAVVDGERAQGLVDPAADLCRVTLRGKLPNEDTVVALDRGFAGQA